MKPEPKPVSTLPSNVDKKLPATNKNAVVKKSHRAVNVPSKTAVNSKLKKHAKTPGIYIVLYNYCTSMLNIINK